jgi:8-oxo-dGTP diphosphatase
MEGFKVVSVESTVSRYEKYLPELTLCFLLNGQTVLLGHKKTGFGKGNIVGIGGKVEKGETPIEAAVREVEEEVFIRPSNLKLAGVMDFYFPYVDSPLDWNQRVFVYTAKSWTGNAAESNEISPQWYAMDNLPFDKMWDDNRYWLEGLLRGKEIWAQFTINQDLNVENWKQRALRDHPKMITLGLRTTC